MSLVLVRTPLRISFLGGGSDLPAFYAREPGAVLSAAINKYTYVLLKSRFEPGVHANWMHKEVVDTVEQLQHELMREALRANGIRSAIEVTTLGDLPAGSGLASSSSITVGLLHAAATYLGVESSPKWLAEEACRIEIDVLAKPIGRQDQYICAFGGLRHIGFYADHVVETRTPAIDDRRIAELQDRLLLVSTGGTRAADPILKGINDAIDDRFPILLAIRDLVTPGIAALSRGEWEEFGALLHRAWEYKRRMAGVTSLKIDAIYRSACDAGASGGKLVGAGQSGFMLFVVDPERRASVREALSPLREVSIKLSMHGSTVIHSDAQS